MITIAFTKIGRGAVSWGGFMDEKNGEIHLMKEVGEFYPGIGISDIDNVGKKILRELEKELGPQKDGECFMVHFDGKL
ncbi:hypothetical protein H7170_00065 [Candidatus Gracilibacteria bacterium]|nr:hypothetical protein [Candidatus Gracilibacteria bacterium]